MDQSQERSTALNRPFSPGSRKGFLVSLGTVSLAACSGGPVFFGLKPQSADIACGPNSCNGGGGGNYNGSGGVNPNAWQYFNQSKTSPGQLFSEGWNTGTLGGAHGSNDPNGFLRYTGSSSFSVDSQNINFTHNLALSGICSRTAFSGSIPKLLPSQGSAPFSAGTITIDAANHTASAQTTVQGHAVKMTVVQLDATGQNYSLTYSDLVTGESHTVPLDLPFSVYSIQDKVRSGVGVLDHERYITTVPPWVCPAIAGLGIIVGAAAILAFVLSVPVALSMVLVDAVAYLSGMGIATAGCGLITLAADVIHESC